MIASVPAAETPLWTVLPFAGLLLSIALLPLAAPRWWHENLNKAKVAALFGLPSLAIAFRYAPHALGHTALEYLAFIALLGSLYVISGGVRVNGSLSGTPLSNTGILGLGAVLANFVGTTGAAMLLIRSFLHANRRRTSRVHLVVFFILVVANCGGCLTPLGDPPLFLGFLKGVPFQWTLSLWKPWLIVVGILLIVFHGLDSRRFGREDPGTRADPDVEPLRLSGSRNLLLLLGVIGVVLASGFWIHPRFGEIEALVFQTAAMAGLAGLSLKLTPRKLREENEFSWHPLVEVAVLFAGIFTAMIAALAVLKTRGSSLGVSSPGQYFWATGSLSALLDNAPTYLAFLSMSQYLPDEVAGTTHVTLAAISCGAVFFGALTYIGNGPNFMVKAIAEQAGVPMPSFFGYMGWSLLILGPVMVLITLLFFRSGA